MHRATRIVTGLVIVGVVLGLLGVIFGAIGVGLIQDPPKAPGVSGASVSQQGSAPVVSDANFNHTTSPPLGPISDAADLEADQAVVAPDPACPARATSAPVGPGLCSLASGTAKLGSEGLGACLSRIAHAPNTNTTLRCVRHLPWDVAIGANATLPSVGSASVGAVSSVVTANAFTITATRRDDVAALDVVANVSLVLVNGGSCDASVHSLLVLLEQIVPATAGRSTSVAVGTQANACLGASEPQSVQLWATSGVLAPSRCNWTRHAQICDALTPEGGTAQNVTGSTGCRQLVGFTPRTLFLNHALSTPFNLSAPLVVPAHSALCKRATNLSFVVAFRLDPRQAASLLALENATFRVTVLSTYDACCDAGNACAFSLGCNGQTRVVRTAVARSDCFALPALTCTQRCACLPPQGVQAHATLSNALAPCSASSTLAPALPATLFGNACGPRVTQTLGTTDVCATQNCSCTARNSNASYVVVKTTLPTPHSATCIDPVTGTDLITLSPRPPHATHAFQCALPAPMDCLVSEWSPWTPSTVVSCPYPACTYTQMAVRAIASAPCHGGAACPALTKTQLAACSSSETGACALNASMSALVPASGCDADTCLQTFVNTTQPATAGICVNGQALPCAPVSANVDLPCTSAGVADPPVCDYTTLPANVTNATSCDAVACLAAMLANPDPSTCTAAQGGCTMQQQTTQPAAVAAFCASGVRTTCAPRVTTSTVPCPAYCVSVDTGSWSAWSVCAPDAALGLCTSTRTLGLHPFSCPAGNSNTAEGAPCPLDANATTQTQVGCSLSPCAYVGWSAWSAWSACDAAGSECTQNRSRTNALVANACYAAPDCEALQTRSESQPCPAAPCVHTGCAANATTKLVVTPCSTEECSAAGGQCSALGCQQTVLATTPACAASVCNGQGDAVLCPASEVLTTEACPAVCVPLPTAWSAWSVCAPVDHGQGCVVSRTSATAYAPCPEHHHCPEPTPNVESQSCACTCTYTTTAYTACAAGRTPRERAYCAVLNGLSVTLGATLQVGDQPALTHALLNPYCGPQLASTLFTVAGREAAALLPHDSNSDTVHACHGVEIGPLQANIVSALLNAYVVSGALPTPLLLDASACAASNGTLSLSSAGQTALALVDGARVADLVPALAVLATTDGVSACTNLVAVAQQNACETFALPYGPTVLAQDVDVLLALFNDAHADCTPHGPGSACFRNP